VTTITLTLAVLAITLVAMLALDRLEQRSKKRDREIMRRFHTYMAKLPPGRPW
jgi:hypothetical protein